MASNHKLSSIYESMIGALDSATERAARSDFDDAVKEIVNKQTMDKSSDKQQEAQKQQNDINKQQEKLKRPAKQQLQKGMGDLEKAQFKMSSADEVSDDAIGQFTKAMGGVNTALDQLDNI
jgi:hypothetical protein